MSDILTVADYRLRTESLISLSFVDTVVHTETAGYASLEGADSSAIGTDSRLGVSTTTFVGISTLLIVIVITVPLLVYTSARKRKRRARLMNVYAAAYTKEGCKAQGKPSNQNAEGIVSQSIGSQMIVGGNGMLKVQDPKTFFDQIFDRFDLDPDPFSKVKPDVADADDEPPRSVTVSAQQPAAPFASSAMDEDDDLYETAATLKTQLQTTKEKGSFALHNFAEGESSTDVGTGGNVGRKGIFRFRMTSTDDKHEAETEKKEGTTTQKRKKKKKKKKKKQELKIGKRVLQPQWFHGDTARPTAAANTDQLQYDDSEMYVIPPPASGRRQEVSRLVEQHSTGYSEDLKMPPSRVWHTLATLSQSESAAHPSNDFHGDDATMERRPLPQPLLQVQRSVSLEGFEDLPELRGLPPGILHDGMLIDLMLEDDGICGYVENGDAPDRTVSRGANGTVGEYLDANAIATNDFGYIDSTCMQRADGGYMEHDGDCDDDKYLQTEEHGTNDEYMQTDGATLRKTSTFPRRAMPAEDSMVLLMNPLSLTLSPSSLPHFDDVASNLTGITGGLSGVSATEMDWVTAQWDSAKTHVDGSIGSGSNAVVSNPLFEDLSDVSDDDGSSIAVTET